MARARDHVVQHAVERRERLFRFASVVLCCSLAHGLLMIYKNKSAKRKKKREREKKKGGRAYVLRIILIFEGRYQGRGATNKLPDFCLGSTVRLFGIPSENWP